VSLRRHRIDALSMRLVNWLSRPGRLDPGAGAVVTHDSDTGTALVPEPSRALSMPSVHRSAASRPGPLRVRLDAATSSEMRWVESSSRQQRGDGERARSQPGPVPAPICQRRSRRSHKARSDPGGGERGDGHSRATPRRAAISTGPPRGPLGSAGPGHGLRSDLAARVSSAVNCRAESRHGPAG